MRVALAIVLAVAAAGPARASEVRVEDGTLVYAAAPGEANDVVLRAGTAPGTLQLQDNGAELAVGAGCSAAVDQTAPPRPLAICAGVERVTVDLGDGEDWFDGTEPQPAVLMAGDGDDFVYGGPGDATLEGGAGRDVLIGGLGRDLLIGGADPDILNGDVGERGTDYGRGPHDVDALPGDADRLDGGPGDDTLLGNGGPDEISGGPGSDSVQYPGRLRGVTVTIGYGADDGEPGEGDTVGGDLERVRTGAYADTVRGTAGAEEISTGAGDDLVDPGAGADVVETGAGADRVELRDGAVDRLVCGSATDGAVVDAADLVTADCEQLDRPVAPARAATVLRVTAVLPASTGVLVRGRLSGGGAGCTGLAIRISGRLGRRRVARSAPLSAGCRFAVRLPLRGRRVRVRARFAGTEALMPARAGR